MAVRTSPTNEIPAGIFGMVTTPADCYTCDREARADHLPPRESIAADDYWRVAHSFNSALPGWLVLLPRRHVTSVGGLTDAEAEGLGTWQVRLSRALHQVLGCRKTYIGQFAESEGFAHVHFHVIGKPLDLAHELRGHRIFQMLNSADHPPVSPQQMDEIASELARHLAY
jgi:diadenosine tetraphosphate (Ap4A) HIT family hydrolase